MASTTTTTTTTKEDVGVANGNGTQDNHHHHSKGRIAQINDFGGGLVKSASNIKFLNPKSALDTMSQFSIGIFFVKLLVLIYDIITFPYFYFTQEAWKILAENNIERAVQEDPKDPYSPYVRVGTPYTDHYAFKAETIPEAQQLTLKMNQPDLPCLGYRDIIQVQMEVQRNGKKLKKYKLTDYKWLSIEKTDQYIGNLAKGFLHHGVKFQEHVLIFAETRMEWFLCAQALWRIGSAVCTLYATLGLEGIVFAINETEVQHIVTTQDLLPNLLKVIDRLPNVRKIYVIEINSGLLNGAAVSEDQFQRAIPGREFQLITYRKLLDLGGSINDHDVSYSRPKPDDVAVILYTSGSTGNPKGVVLLHRNFLSAIQSVYSLLNRELLDTVENQTYYGYLPLAHSLEITAELVSISAGMKIGYGSPFTMTDNGTAIMRGQKGDIRLLQPTLMAGVPLVLDRIRKMITDRFEKRSTFWKQLFKYSCAYKNFWLDHGYDTPLVNRLICARVKSQLGGKLKYMLIGGAPLSPDTQRVMRAFLNIKLLIGYGSTETCGATSITDLEDISIGTIGAPLHGVKVRLLDWPEGGYFASDKPNPRGELVIGGRAVSKGYYKLPEQTDQEYEEKNGEWWFKMGDIGEVNPNGTMKIIDRKKDLVKLQFGEYVSLGKVEADYKNCKYVENFCVYGDSMRTYMIAFLTPSIPALKRLATELNKGDLSVAQLCDDQDIIDAITKEIRVFGTKAGMNKMEIPQKIKICSEEWSPVNGLLTASMKINRKNIQKLYESDIERLYG